MSSPWQEFSRTDPCTCGQSLESLWEATFSRPLETFPFLLDRVRRQTWPRPLIELSNLTSWWCGRVFGCHKHGVRFLGLVKILTSHQKYQFYVTKKCPSGLLSRSQMLKRSPELWLLASQNCVCVDKVLKAFAMPRFHGCWKHFLSCLTHTKGIRPWPSITGRSSSNLTALNIYIYISTVQQKPISAFTLSCIKG